MILGVTTGQDGSWTSWPPHQHTETFEEIYVYYGMGDPGFALHLEITEDGRETAEVVRDGDVVVVPKGYHPLVACPGTKLKYVFIMAAIKDGIEPAKYRELSLIHPEFLSHVTK